jgi:hypothetical protein
MGRLRGRQNKSEGMRRRFAVAALLEAAAGGQALRLAAYEMWPERSFGQPPPYIMNAVNAALARHSERKGNYPVLTSEDVAAEKRLRRRVLPPGRLGTMSQNHNRRRESIWERKIRA